MLDILKNEVGYINYVKDNVDKASRKILGKTYNKQGNIRASLKIAKMLLMLLLKVIVVILKLLKKLLMTVDLSLTNHT